MWSFFSRDPSKDFNYEIGEPVPGLGDKSIWKLHRAKKKGAEEEVSVFMFDIKNGSETQLDVARSSVKRLKTLRHPSVLTYLDSLETDKMIFMATEFVIPLQTRLDKLLETDEKDRQLAYQQRDLYLAWGIFQITRALSFLNNDGNLRHNNVCMWSVFVNAAGEWKLGGVEYVAGTTDGIGLPIKILPALDKYDPPEKADPGRQRLITKCSTDMWGLGCLIWEVFNGPLPVQSSLQQLEKVPQQLSGVYCELVGANPGSRPNPADVITRCRKTNGYFKNDLVDTLLFLEEIQIKDKSEKSKFFGSLTPLLDNFPKDVCVNKILPQLINAFVYGDAGSSILAPMFKLGSLLEEAEYQKQIVPCVVKLFASNDRATRVRLLQQLELFIGHLQSATVNDQIFPQIAHGFMDTNPTIREQTVKSIIHLAPKLNYNNLNVEVLRHFARLQARDDQAGIRTNTTVCLGKIAQHLHPQIRQRVLVSAFIRAMRDTFPPTRQAGVLALAATQQYFLLSEVANRILPALCPLSLDPDKSVREALFRTLKGFLGKLEKVSEDPTLRESMEADVHTATPSLSNAAATWAGWAVTAVTAKFYRSQSDTVKSSVVSQHSRMLSKPGSLEQPSSSSISTTTSSVTSMTSLEQEQEFSNRSVSDYDETWDTENWGDMDTLAAQSSTEHPRSPGPGTPGASGTSLSTRSNDGWDTEEWGSLDETPELNSPEAVEGWGAPDFPGSDEMPRSASMYSTWAETNKDKDDLSIESNKGHADARSPGSRSGGSTGAGTGGSGSGGGGWEDTEWEPMEAGATAAAGRHDEARRRREEKKLQRQKELELRRASRTSTGPMKLGAKKV
ncbi:N-terminal kinase-like protein [Thrips palmi]|uniref:N-terminal kinase-like protein n=1 Tax=Thrips palmi TaxID=161013 RepID=A0A6P9A1X8_THRPL|nr:N-terminal kinase-like protein [Thrips palmi]XP_034250811.1 N-terminal kinase-like protein [Thrips palmi]XP_034250812.1 N-terminal kinase-like protein [Thrips palmi]XP_034250813.1 N-terminal kinase-like protein [Thrips palmi]